MTEPSSPRTQNPRGEGAWLRNDLLEAALHVVDREGAGALALRAVAREAGVTAPSIYRHFTNLNALVTAVVAACFGELAEQICRGRDAEQGAVDRLLGCCRGYLRYAAQHPHRYAALFGRTTASADSDGPVTGELAFDLLVDAVDAVSAVDGVTTSTRDVATTIWVGLDGYANLRVLRPRFPWPNEATMLHHLVLNHASPRGSTRVEHGDPPNWGGKYD